MYKNCILIEMSNFNPDTLPANFRAQYIRFITKAVNKIGRINLGLKWPNGKGEYSNLSQCWASNVSLTSQGYGQFEGQALHRYSYWIHNGQPDITESKMCIAHACDNTECSNPEHLTYVSRTENMNQSIMRIQTIIPAPARIRATVACNACRIDTHYACVGDPCSRCVKNKIVCVREDAVVQPQAFKKGDKAGEKNNKAVVSALIVYTIRKRYMDGLKGYDEWATEFGVKYGSIQKYVARKTEPGMRTWDYPEATPEGFWLTA